MPEAVHRGNLTRWVLNPSERRQARGRPAIAFGQVWPTHPVEIGERQGPQDRPEPFDHYCRFPRVTGADEGPARAGRSCVARSQVSWSWRTIWTP